MPRFTIFTGAYGVCVFCLFCRIVMLCFSGVVPLNFTNPTPVQSCVYVCGCPLIDSSPILFSSELRDVFRVSTIW
uniref:Putative secreted peptide n=1 Tax=Anopheles braziliensis TaxID=58242 RepID=A0A2M3ZUT6_9DIPT